MNEIYPARPGEGERLETLAKYPLDAEPLRSQLNRLAGLAAQICDAPISLVSIVQAERQVFVGKSGLDADETPREMSFCAHAMFEDRCMVIPDALEDERFSGNPLVLGHPNIRFYAGHPLLSPEGVPLGSLCVIDSKPRANLTPSQMESLNTLAQAAMGLLDRSRIEKSSQLKEERARLKLVDLEQRFNLLADAIPQMVWSTDQHGNSDYFNSGWVEFTGRSKEESFGNHWLDRLHEGDRALADDVWSTSVARGTDYVVKYRLRRHDGCYRWVLARGLPLRDPDGSIRRWIGTCTDIHDEVELAEQKEILSHELSHRIKNIFAVIGGLIALTSQGREELADYSCDLQGRVLALSRAHDYARPHSYQSETPLTKRGLTMAGLIQQLLAPYEAEHLDRICIDAPELEVNDSSVTPFALFFHELATNAAKYGALSVESGRVDVRFEEAETCRITWRESGGPPVLEPGHQGFGSRLLRICVERQLGGRVTFDWDKDGLCVTAEVPMRSINLPSA